jgi:hypothetical protein
VPAGGLVTLDLKKLNRRDARARREIADNVSVVGPFEEATAAPLPSRSQALPALPANSHDPHFVTPAKAGVQAARHHRPTWIPAVAGMTCMLRLRVSRRQFRKTPAEI